MVVEEVEGKSCSGEGVSGLRGGSGGAGRRTGDEEDDEEEEVWKGKASSGGDENLFSPRRRGELEESNCGGKGGLCNSGEEDRLGILGALGGGSGGEDRPGEELRRVEGGKGPGRFEGEGDFDLTLRAGEGMAVLEAFLKEPS